MTRKKATDRRDTGQKFRVRDPQFGTCGASDELHVNPHQLFRFVVSWIEGGLLEGRTLSRR
jgi:hypothetical protein